jgi:hypothetical protein
MRTTTKRSEHAWLLKMFHTKCTMCNIGVDEKYAMVASYGHDSSRDMTVSELADANRKLDVMLNPELTETDMWRKRVMGAIGGWLKVMSIEQGADKLKAIACRASGFGSFNEIPKERLVNLYYAFLKKQKDFKAVEGIAKEELENLTFLN